MRSFRRLTVTLALALAGAIGIGHIASAQKAAPSSSAAPSASATKGQLLDINTATQDQLKALPGIGDAYSKRIIDGRPYTAKNQLVSRGILPQATYDKVSAMIIAKRVAGK